jgi:hypothetical protein
LPYDETHKEKRWRITYTDKLGIAMNRRWTYADISFDTEIQAQNELRRILKQSNPNSSNQDYRIEPFICDVLDKPIYPYKD